MRELAPRIQRAAVGDRLATRGTIRSRALRGTGSPRRRPLRAPRRQVVAHRLHIRDSRLESRTRDSIAARRGVLPRSRRSPAACGAGSSSSPLAADCPTPTSVSEPVKIVVPSDARVRSGGERARVSSCGASAVRRRQTARAGSPGSSGSGAAQVVDGFASGPQGTNVCDRVRFRSEAPDKERLPALGHNVEGGRLRVDAPGRRSQPPPRRRRGDLPDPRRDRRRRGFTPRLEAEEAGAFDVAMIGLAARAGAEG